MGLEELEARIVPVTVNLSVGTLPSQFQGQPVYASISGNYGAPGSQVVADLSWNSQGTVIPTPLSALIGGFSVSASGTYNQSTIQLTNVSNAAEITPGMSVYGGLTAGGEALNPTAVVQSVNTSTGVVTLTQPNGATFTAFPGNVSFFDPAPIALQASGTVGNDYITLSTPSNAAMIQTGMIAYGDEASSVGNNAIVLSANSSTGVVTFASNVTNVGTFTGNVTFTLAAVSLPATGAYNQNSVTLTNISDASKIQVGMIASGTGLGSTDIVTAVNSTNGVVTLFSQNVAAVAGPVVFSPNPISVGASGTISANTITLAPSDASKIQVGMTVFGGIPGGQAWRAMTS